RVACAPRPPERALLGGRHVLDRGGNEVARPGVGHPTAAHKQRDAPPRDLLLREHAHRRDARAAGDEKEVARAAVHDERRAEGSEEIELVAFAAQGDPLAAGAEWLHDELDLAGLPVDAIEGVRPPKERLE